MTFTIGIISDTHGLLRPEALRVLAHVDRIIHGGDKGVFRQPNGSTLRDLSSTDFCNKIGPFPTRRIESAIGSATQRGRCVATRQ